MEEKLRMRKIPIAKPLLGELEAKAAHDVILTGWVTQGPKVQEFEKDFCEYTGAKYAVAVSNCTTGLHLSLIVAGISCGDEVICPSMSYIATANCIRYVGAEPVFAEVGNDFNLDIEDVRTKITPKTKAILIVHQIGNPADIAAYQELCNAHNLKLIEDGACAIGSEYKSKKIGSHSELVCFSFHPRKVITTGDGGMITTNNEEFYIRLKHLRQHGMSVNDQVRHNSKKVIIEEYLEVGYNYRMTDIQAAVGIEQLKRLNGIVLDRRRIAEMYNEAFKNSDSVEVLNEGDKRFNYQSYSLLLTAKCPISRNDLMQELLDKGISTRRGIMTAHREKAYSSKSYSLPQSEFYSDNSILLPIYVTMDEEDISYIIESVKQFI